MAGTESAGEDMKKLIILALMTLCGCQSAGNEKTEETPTDAPKTPGIASETASEIETASAEFEIIDFSYGEIRYKQNFIANTAEKEWQNDGKTEAKTTESDILAAENEQKSANNENKMQKKEEPQEADSGSFEESTGDIDVNGYGWVELQYSAPYHIMDGHLTRSNGSIRCFGHRETWYSTNEGCGQTTARSIPGKHVADDGTIRDGDGFICVASSDLPFYSIVMTSVGPGKVYDCGCSSGTIDIYTNW